MTVRSRLRHGKPIKRGLLVAFLLLCGNLGWTSENSSTNAFCVATGVASVIAANGYRITVFHPNDTSEPDVWEGPVCILNTYTWKECQADYSLVRDIEVDIDQGFVSFYEFSGSLGAEKKISLLDCAEIPL